MTPRASSRELEIAQARGAAYALVSYGFQYPDPSLIDALADPERWSSWPEVLQHVAPDTAKHLAAVRASLRVGSPSPSHSERNEESRRGGPPTFSKGGGLNPIPPPPRDMNVAAPEPPDSSGAEHDGASVHQETFNRLFGHAVRGKCPPYELEYGRSEIIQQTSFLADVTGFYAAFGMEVHQDTDDRADHVAVESEFMKLLCAKEAYAIEQRSADHVDICITAQRDFLKDHLARWLPAFTHRVRRADPQGFYGALAGFASTYVAAECRRFDITAGPHAVELRPSDPVLDTSISCGPAPSGAGDAGDALVQLTVDCERRQNP